MAENIKAEKKHYDAWLRQNESVLIDALLIINGIHCGQPASNSSVTYLYKLIDDELSKTKEKIFPEKDSPIYAKVSKVLDLIYQNKMLTPKKSQVFVESHPINALRKIDPRNPKLFLETTIKPTYFISRLLEYAHMVPIELHKGFDSIIRESIGKEIAPADKPADQRELKNLYRMVHTVADTHYSYDPKVSKNTGTAKMMRLMQRKGHKISQATVKRMFDKAFRIAEEELDQK